MPASNSSVLAGVEGVRGWQEELYRDVHAHPELSHQEHRTARLVAGRLGESGCEVHEGVGGTGVVGVLHNGGGPVVLLRADMDALPVREATGLTYASVENATVDGAEVPVMHACGHDVHVACLLGAVDVLARTRSHWSGTVVAVFQPAEEVADGARGMIENAWSTSWAPSTWPCASTCSHSQPGTSPPGPVRPWLPPTACGSPSTGAEHTGPCPRRRSTPSSSRR